MPLKKVPQRKKILVIYPHPDDESLTCGGTVFDASRHHSLTSLALLTKGERGVEGAIFTPSLKQTRTKEAVASAKALNVSRLIHDDFGDGELVTKKSQLKKRVDSIIQSIDPDLIITYDLSGLYGHPDHIIISQLVTDYVKRHSNIRLWYASRPAKVYRQMKLPVHMATDRDYLLHRKYPTIRIRLSLPAIIAKYRSLAAHRSQHFAFKKGRPWLPLWFYVATQTHEYFYEVQ